jgi:hypothetical protein
MAHKQEVARDKVKEGIDLYNHDKFVEARDKFEEACNKDPVRPTAAIIVQDNTDAVEWLEKAKAALKPAKRQRSKTIIAVKKDEVVTVRRLAVSRLSWPLKRPRRQACRWKA